ncbi:MAG: CopG family antitoxin [Opitutaceae bacterium]|jgi:predicted DNA binding CopG/RHH family protein
MKKLYVKETGVERPAIWQKAKFAAFPNLKPTSTAISLRVPNSVLARLKVQAHRRGMPYQSFIKSVLAAAVDQR